MTPNAQMLYDQAARVRRTLLPSGSRPRRRKQAVAADVAAGRAAAAVEPEVAEHSRWPRPDRGRASSFGSPSDTDGMLLSGTLAAARAIANRALAVDVPMGQGHVVMFALRPFWRWQTQGTFMLAFNAILNWDHLDAGKAATPSGATASGQ